MKYSINGYWKDDKSEFTNYIVKSGADVSDDDDEIFFYGLTEDDIKQAIAEGENNELEFVITSYATVN